jgi:Clostripain family
VWQKVDALTEAWQNTRDNLLIYQDTRGERGTPSLMQVVYQAGAAYTTVIKEYPDANSADPQIFSEMLRDATSAFPAPSYGLLLFSHGTGWLPAGSYASPRALPDTGKEMPSGKKLRSIIDDAGREMEITGFAAAIPDHQFDFIVLEACLMASAEVAYELRNKADFLLASSAEILSPGFTPVYAEILGALFVQPEAALAEAADAYYAHCDKQESPYRSATASVIRLDKMEKLAIAMREVYRLLPDEMTAGEAEEIQGFDRSADRLFFDMGSLITYTSENLADSESRPVLGNAAQVLQEAVPYKSATPFFVNLPVRSHSGLTVYIPQPDYPGLNKAWQQTGWRKQMK